MATAPLREGTWQNNFLSTLVIQPSYIVWTAKDSGQIPEYSYILFFIEKQPFLRALIPGPPSPAQVQPVLLLLLLLRILRARVASISTVPPLMLVPLCIP